MCFMPDAHGNMVGLAVRGLQLQAIRAPGDARSVTVPADIVPADMSVAVHRFGEFWMISLNDKVRVYHLPVTFAMIDSFREATADDWIRVYPTT